MKRWPYLALSLHRSRSTTFRPNLFFPYKGTRQQGRLQVCAHRHPYADKHAGKANGVGDPDPEGMGHWTPYLSSKFRSIISILSAQHTTTTGAGADHRFWNIHRGYEIMCGFLKGFLSGLRMEQLVCVCVRRLD